MDLSAKEIGNRIKQYRKAKHITQKELAEMVDCAEMTISQYERGLYSPKSDMRTKIANALSVSYMDLFMDMTPETFDSPEDFKKWAAEVSRPHNGISQNIHVSHGDRITNEVTYDFRRSGLTESEAYELDNYYSYLMYKRNKRGDQDKNK